jgi:hypothetical protein
LDGPHTPTFSDAVRAAAAHARGAALATGCDRSAARNLADPWAAVLIWPRRRRRRRVANPAPVDEAVLLLAAGLLYAFYRQPTREAWQRANRTS